MSVSKFSAPFMFSAPELVGPGVDTCANPAKRDHCFSLQQWTHLGNAINILPDCSKSNPFLAINKLVRACPPEAATATKHVSQTIDR